MIDVDKKPDSKAEGSEKGKKVTFAPDVKPASGPSTPSTTPAPDGVKTEDSNAMASKAEPELDGVIGKLEIYQSGTVKIRLNNGILFDVSISPITKRSS